MSEPILMKAGMYIMKTEPISTAYCINPSHQSLCECASVLSLQGNGSLKYIPAFSVRQLFDKHVPAGIYTLNNTRIVGKSKVKIKDVPVTGHGGP
jgi:hypothetical protein